MILEKIQSMLASCDGDGSHFPPTELYNEGWLLRLLLDWFDGHRIDGYPLSFAEGATWYSEARLRSQFRPSRRRGERLGETHTHADGVIGHFDIGRDGRTDLSLRSGSTQFVVLEAKMFSGLSRGVTHAREYDQAARTVACMAQVIADTKPPPEGLGRLNFYVLAPSKQLENGTLKVLVTRESIGSKVKDRVAQYRGKKDKWFENDFLPFLSRVELGCESWEEIIEAVVRNDRRSGREISQFYQRCLDHNTPQREKSEKVRPG